jgi:nickel-type superoxide dismutase maturation protease
VGHRQATRYSAGGDNRAPWPAALPVAVATAITAAALAALWAWDRSQRTAVAGDSMVPALQPGDRLVVWRTKRFRPGDVVAAGDPRDPGRTVLKRAGAVGPGWIFLVGDNEMHSTDSRHFGPVPLSLVRGKALYRYAPPGRAGRLRRVPPKGP